MERYCVSGVYALWCEQEGRCYVGGGLNVYERRKKYIYRLRARKHSLQKAFDKYGESILCFVVLEECSPALVQRKEKQWVARLKDLLFSPLHASLTSGTPGVRSKKRTRERISKALTGLRKSLEHRQNLWKNRVGWKQSDESKKKISDGLLKAARRGQKVRPS